MPCSAWATIRQCECEQPRFTWAGSTVFAIGPAVREFKSRVDAGPGYRVYYTQRGTDLIVLLVGGDKASQHRDIERAVELASNL